MRSTIFLEPPPDEDETWTHGAMLGGMCGYDVEDLADSYFQAGGILIDTVSNGSSTGREVINPVMYVYRHGLELYLKCAVGSDTRTHDLETLLNRFCHQIREQYHEEVPTWITTPISEFATYDRGSDVFRYENTKHLTLQVNGEFWIDLPSLKKIMARLRWALRRVIIANRTGEIPPVAVS